jgi:hypothetical protein
VLRFGNAGDARRRSDAATEGRAALRASTVSVVAADIQAGIEKHVEEEVARGGGYHSLPFAIKTLRLELVRVHTEKREPVRARALHDHVIDRLRHTRYGPGRGQGDAVHACSADSGNCTDAARRAKVEFSFVRRGPGSDPPRA